MTGDEYKSGDLDEALDAVRETATHAAVVGMRALAAMFAQPDPTVGPEPGDPATTEPGGAAWNELTRVLMRVADALGVPGAYEQEPGTTSGQPFYRIDGPAILRAAEAAGRPKDYARSHEERGTERRAVLCSIDDRSPERVAESAAYLAGLTEAAWLGIVRQRVAERVLSTGHHADGKG